MLITRRLNNNNNKINQTYVEKPLEKIEKKRK
jgi:hypothetical protein